LLAELTEEFANAVIAGDVEQAKKLYAPARGWRSGRAATQCCGA
jgi:iron uptake system EfeUOB component EfeO/EfeM